MGCNVIDDGEKKRFDGLFTLIKGYVYERLTIELNKYARMGYEEYMSNRHTGGLEKAFGYIKEVGVNYPQVTMDILHGIESIVKDNNRTYFGEVSSAVYCAFWSCMCVFEIGAELEYLKVNDGLNYGDSPKNIGERVVRIMIKDKLFRSDIRKYISIYELAQRLDKGVIVGSDGVGLLAKVYEICYEIALTTFFISLEREKTGTKGKELPAELDTLKARDILGKAIRAGLCTDLFYWNGGITLLAYFAKRMSDYLELPARSYKDDSGNVSRGVYWRPFITLFDYKDKKRTETECTIQLSQVAYKARGSKGIFYPKGADIVDALFP